jgi:prophage regulatory protein
MEQAARLKVLIRRPAVLDMTGLSKSQLYEMMGAGEFPRSVQLAGRSVAWEQGEVQAWINTKLAARRIEAQS